MTIRVHLSDLKEQRQAYSRLLEALETGKLLTNGSEDTEARCADLRRKIRDLDTVLEGEETKHRR